MKAIAQTNTGIEDITALEIKELIKAHSEIYQGFVAFEAKEKDIIKLIYLGRTITKIILIDDVNKWAEGKTFAVRGEHRELEKKIAGKITKGKVNLDNPDIIIYAIDEEHYGIDLTGEDLSKRDYRIFLGPESLKGNIAYAALRIAGYTPDKRILDCFCRSGIIPIEAALFVQNKSVHCYSKDKFLFLKFWPQHKKYLEELDKETKKTKTNINCSDPSINHVAAAKKNAKIAGIHKQIKFSRIDLKDTDLKYEKIDIIITIPQQETEEQLFKQAKKILTEHGKIVLIMKKGAEKFRQAAQNYKLTEERTAMQGKEEWNVLVFQR